MKKFAFEIKWAFRYIFAYLLWICIEKYFGYYDHNISKYFLYSLLFNFVMIYIYIFAIRDKKKTYFNNVMHWRQGATSAVALSVIIAILMPFCQVLIHRGIAPEFFPNMIEYRVSKGGDLATAEAFFNLKSYIFQSVFNVLSYGVVVGAVISLMLQTKSKK